MKYLSKKMTRMLAMLLVFCMTFSSVPVLGSDQVILLENDQNIGLSLEDVETRTFTEDFNEYKPETEILEDKISTDKPETEMPEDKISTDKPETEIPEDKISTDKPETEIPEDKISTDKPETEMPEDKTTTKQPGNLTLISELKAISSAALSLQVVDNVEYNIYPVVREIKYGNVGFAIEDKVNVVYGSTIDNYTRNHLTEALGNLQNPPTIETSDAPVAGSVNILIGVKGSGDAADTALKDIDANMTVVSAGVTTENEDIFAENSPAKDAYIIQISEDGTIAVLGKDTDAAFYGLTTLKHIFSQMSKDDTNVIRTLTIRDYASVSYRGFIEGYYGFPWSHEGRISLMEWGSEWKMNGYVFAPKNDPYHNEKWREPYPQEELKKMGELAETGNRTKNRFIYSLHCFMNDKFDPDNFDRDIKVVTDKFESLYNVGVRQFAILADDAGDFQPENMAKIMNALNEWCKQKDGVYSLMYCPDNYNDSWASGNNGAAYDRHARLNAKMDQDIQIFWTGQGVCGHAGQAGAETFMNKINEASEKQGLNATSRRPLMWLNWPVNDVNKSRLVMGPGSNEGGDKKWAGDNIAILDKGAADYWTGIISNPMTQSELNKVPLFAVADFAWNDDDYDGQKSWSDSFQYIDPQAADALKEMSKHLSDPSPNGHSLICGESEDIKDKLEKFLSDYEKGLSISSQGEELIKEFDIIIKACDDLPKLSKNKLLLEQIDMHRIVLKELVTSSKKLVETAILLEKKDTNGIWSNYSEAVALLTQSSSHIMNTIDGPMATQSGSKRIAPFAESLAEMLSDSVKEIIDPSFKPPAVPTFYTSTEKFWSAYDPSIFIDGDITTGLYYDNNAMVKDEYFGLTYSRPVSIDRFRVITGEGGYTLNNAVLEYKSEGDKEYKTVPKGEFKNSYEWDFSLEPLQNVVDIRVRLLENAGKFLQLFEIGIAPSKMGEPSLGGTIFHSSDWSIYDNKPDKNAVDDDDNTYAYYSMGLLKKDDYIGVDLGAEVSLGRIRILQGRNNTDWDRMYDAVLEYSNEKDGPYTALKTDINELEFEVDVADDDIKARYVRLRNGTDMAKWFAIRSFAVYDPNSGTPAYTNSKELERIKCAIEMDNALIRAGKGKTVTLKPGEYIGLKLPRIRRIINLNKNIKVQGVEPTFEVGANELEMKPLNYDVSENNPLNARYIRYANNTNEPITFDILELSVKSSEVYPIKEVETGLGAIGYYTVVGSLLDGLIDSKSRFVGVQKKDAYSIIDIGQVMKINSIQLVISDSEQEWLRHAKIEVSKNEDGPWTYVSTIGKEGAKLDTALLDKENSGWEHTTSYCISGSKPTDNPANADGRYIKITSLADINSWTSINEICINSFVTGNSYTPPYMKPEDNPTFEAAEEVRGFAPTNMIDGNLRTTYRSSKQEAGYILYRFSQDYDKYKLLNILQNANTLSSATVSIRQANETDFTVIGLLNFSMNEFNISSFEQIVEIKIEWDDNTIAPEIHEMMLKESVSSAVDKTELNELIKKAEEFKTDGYSPELVKAFELALKNAKSTAQSNYILQSAVDQAVRELSPILAQMMGDLPATTPIELKDNTTNIQLKAEIGILPNASILHTKQITDGGLFDIATEALKQTVQRSYMYDITVRANTLIVEPKDGTAQLFIPIPKGYSTSHLKVFEIDGSGTLKEIPFKLQASNAVFNTDHFSKGTAFVIAEMKYNNSSSDSGDNNYSGGGTGSSSPNTTEEQPIQNNADGSVTVTKIDKVTGTITKTTTAKDGTIFIIETQEDGTITQKIENTNGVKVESVKNSKGNITAQATIPKDKTNVKIIIPLQQAKLGMVAVIVHEDGTEEIVRKSVTTDDGIALILDKSASFKIIENSKTFSDMSSHWSIDAVNFVTSRALFYGTSDDEFSPNKSMTRAMLATVLYRLENEPDAIVNNIFSDVAEGQYYSNAVMWASNKGIVSGTGKGFNPDNNVTREQLAAMLYRYAGSPDVTGNTNSFSDTNNVSAWAVDSIVWATENGIITGKGENILAPQDNATRAEVATMIERFVQNIVK